MFLSKSLLFDWFLDPFMSQRHSYGPFLCKYWWHNIKSWILGGKSGLQKCFLQALENEDKIMICQFFKFSTLEHFWGFKWIAWVDNRVVLLFYSFQGVRVDLGGELEKLTKYTQIWKYCKFMLLDFDSLYQWENSSPPQCVIYIRKNLDLLFHLVYAELVFWYENHKCIAFWKEMQIYGRISLFCKWSDIKILCLSIQFFEWFDIQNSEIQNWQM